MYIDVRIDDDVVVVDDDEDDDGDADYQHRTSKQQQKRRTPIHPESIQRQSHVINTKRGTFRHHHTTHNTTQHLHTYTEQLLRCDAWRREAESLCWANVAILIYDIAVGSMSSACIHTIAHRSYEGCAKFLIDHPPLRGSVLLSNPHTRTILCANMNRWRFVYVCIWIRDAWLFCRPAIGLDNLCWECMHSCQKREIF